jgi:hypothetical protein
MHYYLFFVPPVCLLAAAPVARALERMPWLWAAIVLPAAGFLVFARWNDAYLQVPAREIELPRQVGTFLREATPPEARVFVWGNSPEINFYARRRLGSRFLFTNYQVGKIWGTPSDRDGATDTDRYVVPESWPLLLHDLDTRPPEVFVDAAAGRLRDFRNHPAPLYPPLRAFLARCYDRWQSIDDVVLYRRTRCS